MRALVYHGPGRKAWQEVPNPTIVDDTAAVIRVDAVTICGTDPADVVVALEHDDRPAAQAPPHPQRRRAGGDRRADPGP